MRFSNLTPADKLKAAGLTGLIVVALVFVAHAMMGIVMPEQARAPKSQPDAAVAAQGSLPTPPPAAPVEAKGGLLGTPAVAGLGLPPSAVHDPFVPIRKDPKDVAPRISGPPKERMPGGTLPDFGRVLPMQPGMPSSFDPTPTPQPTPPPPPEPKIQVLGYVAGDATVVTLGVDGKVGNFRPGDAIVKGYRMMGNDSAGVRIRKHGTVVVVPVGESLNMEPAKPAADART